MAKITISYELDPYEDKEELRQLYLKDSAFSALWEIDQSLRSKLKHGDDDWLEIKGVYEYLECIRQFIYDSGALDCD